jgi:1-phosphofructokinase
MVAAVCANPCVDRAVCIDNFAYGGMNRILECREDGAGKGVNVALGCARLGMEAACIGILPRERSEPILRRLRDGGCASEFIPCAGAVRVNTKVMDRAAGVVTELNEGGVPISGNEAEMLVDAVARWAARCSHIVLTGSAPPGCPADFYRTMLEAVKAAAPGCACVLDAEGALLKEGLKAAPDIVKPNRYELELLCGRKLPEVGDIHSEAMRLIGRGVRLAAVTMGGGGAYVTDGKEAFYAPALKIDVKGTVGAGDSFMAGMLLGLTKGLALEGVLRHAMAAAASSLSAEGTGLIDTDLFKEYLPQIHIERVA